jgi:hypothetical protein
VFWFADGDQLFATKPAARVQEEKSKAAALVGGAIALAVLAVWFMNQSAPIAANAPAITHAPAWRTHPSVAVAGGPEGRELAPLPVVAGFF